jgi:pilus assembly protein CpaB
MIVISVIIGLAAVVLASRWVAQQAEVSTSQVVVAKTDIELGARLSPDMLSVQNWPEGSVPKGAMLTKDMDSLLKDPKTNEGRVVRVSILRGEPILESKLAPAGAQPGLSFAIKEGMRAITVRVNDVVGVAGFALPGNYVDILVNTVDETSKAAGENKTVSKIVLEHILLLAVAQETGQGEGKPKVVNAVTLEVTPEQAEKIDLARSVGSLSLVLRNQLDNTLTSTAGVYKKDLLKSPGPEVKSVEAKPAEIKPTAQTATTSRKPRAKTGQPKAQVEVIRGETRSVEEFDIPAGEK